LGNQTTAITPKLIEGGNNRLKVHENSLRVQC
jgi:hypothetical protein